MQTLPQITSRSLKDRLTKVPDWFRPKNQKVEAYARANLQGMQKRQEDQQRRVAATKAAALPKAAEIIRRFDVRAKSFLGGKSFPWTSGSWERIQISRYRKDHPIRYAVWRCTGLLAPTL
jgi:hypothetical protein